MLLSRFGLASKTTANDFLGKALALLGLELQMFLISELVLKLSFNLEGTVFDNFYFFDESLFFDSVGSLGQFFVDDVIKFSPFVLDILLSVSTLSTVSSRRF